MDRGTPEVGSGPEVAAEEVRPPQEAAASALQIVASAEEPPIPITPAVTSDAQGIEAPSAIVGALGESEVTSATGEMVGEEGYLFPSIGRGFPPRQTGARPKRRELPAPRLDEPRHARAEVATLPASGDTPAADQSSLSTEPEVAAFVGQFVQLDRQLRGEEIALVTALLIDEASPTAAKPARANEPAAEPPIAEDATPRRATPLEEAMAAARRPDRRLKGVRAEQCLLARQPPKIPARIVSWADDVEEMEVDEAPPVQSVAPVCRPPPAAVVQPRSLLPPRIVPIENEPRGPQEWDTPSAAAIIERPRRTETLEEKMARPMLRLEDGYKRHRYNPRRQLSVDDYEPRRPPSRTPSPELGPANLPPGQLPPPRTMALMEETERLRRQVEKRAQEEDRRRRQEAADRAYRQAMEEQSRRLDALHGREAQERRRRGEEEEQRRRRPRSADREAPERREKAREKSRGRSKSRDASKRSHEAPPPRQNLVPEVQMPPESRVMEAARKERERQWRRAIASLNLPRPLVPDRPHVPSPGDAPMPVKKSGLIFGGLKAIPSDRSVDPPPYGCFNCWHTNHRRRQCPYPSWDDYCLNCGRRAVDLTTCPRCAEAYAARTATEWGPQQVAEEMAELPASALSRSTQPGPQPPKDRSPPPAEQPPRPSAPEAPTRVEPEPPAPDQDALTTLLDRLQGCSPQYIQWAIRRQFGGSTSPPPRQ